MEHGAMRHERGAMRHEPDEAAQDMMAAEMPAQHRERMRRMMGHVAKKQARPQAPASRSGRSEAKDSAAHHG
jgi:hypothetical protein